jgi:hypothetical protein
MPSMKQACHACARMHRCIRAFFFALQGGVRRGHMYTRRSGFVHEKKHTPGIKETERDMHYTPYCCIYPGAIDTESRDETFIVALSALPGTTGRTKPCAPPTHVPPHTNIIRTHSRKSRQTMYTRRSGFVHEKKHTPGIKETNPYNAL